MLLRRIHEPFLSGAETAYGVVYLRSMGPFLELFRACVEQSDLVPVYSANRNGPARHRPAARR